MKQLLSIILAFMVTHSAIADIAAETLQHKLNALRSMSADFSQIIRTKNRIVSRSSGRMALQRPGKFRWDTRTPMAQLVVADSHYIWVYDVDLEQVTVKKQVKGLGGTAALFLGGYTDTLTRDFTVSESKQGNHERYSLHSKSAKDNFQRIKLDFSGDALYSIELFDQLGQHTMVQLSRAKVNPTLSANLFSFKPPKGVDIVQQ
ncbi:MAG: outer membrane lipoprotein carrier protein LolA [Legionellales bacterium RIFCSPHIGHO2_12_FULL_42_9]|nr:MAG: outer membrane lipoprotein carrier protein LolA [Legionellales bacterium RIFCSPHIGHO2_12_FULL_42_9]